MLFFLFASLMAAAAASQLSASSRTENNGASNTNVNSPFTQVRNVEVCVTERRIYTPAAVLIGTSTQLLRCLYKDPDQCEVLYTTSEAVLSLLVVGEYIYAGLNRKILKCNLNQAESCQIYLSCDTHVQSLTTANGKLYAGLENRTVLTCGLDAINSCRVFHTFDYSVYALMQENEYIYVGLWNGKVMRCTLDPDSSCTLVYTLHNGITGISSVGNSIFAVSYTDSIWKCVRKPDAIDSCESMPLGYDYPIDMAIFYDGLYTVKGSGNIYICQWESNKTCTVYRTNLVTSSIAFAYATYAMESQYRGEDTTCLQQSKSECPPAVVYYNAWQRSHLQVQVKDGKLINSQGELVDTSAADEGHAGPAAIFAMGPDGRILLSTVHRRGMLQTRTSSFFAGNPVAGAGEMVVKNGVIQKIRACSAHYRPDTELNRQVVQSLRDQGYTDHIDSVMCKDGEFFRSESNVQ